MFPNLLLVWGGGGGEGTSTCSVRETPIFRPKFHLSSITIFSLKADFTFFAFPDTSTLKFIYVRVVHRRLWPAYCSQPERFSFGQRPGDSDRPEYQQVFPFERVGADCVNISMVVSKRSNQYSMR